MAIPPTAESGFSQTENSGLFFFLPLSKKKFSQIFCGAQAGWPAVGHVVI